MEAEEKKKEKKKPETDAASFEEKIARQMEKLKSSVGAIKRGEGPSTSTDLT